MRERSFYKSRGKAAFKNNYWMCVLVALVLMIVGGTSFSSENKQTTNQNTNQGIQHNSPYVEFKDENGYTIYNYEGEDEAIDAEFSVTKDLDGLLDSGSDMVSDNALFNLPIVGSSIKNSLQSAIPYADVFLVFGLGLFTIVVLIVTFIIGAFVLSIIEIGGYRFFIDNSKEKASPGLLFSAFQSGYYLNTVKIVFFETVYLFLWTLLFIIPGVIKAYEYRMIPYILAEHPELDKEEVFARSKRMMDGNKFGAFLLDLSFIGWNLLSVITLGLVGIFWTNPYKQATNAELYLDLKEMQYL